VERVTEKQTAERRKTLRPHPIRDAIVDALRSSPEPLSPTRLSRLTGNTIGATAYHVRTLVSAGILELADEGRIRGAVEHFYALAPDERIGEWESSVEKLQAACDALTIPDPAGGLPTYVVLDAQARDELQAVLEKIKPSVLKIARGAVARRSASDGNTNAGAA
jgi:DNA-binding transcriptional ArsR family regulator